MSKELEMLRVIVGFSGFSPLITRDNLRRILARMEAAERGCERCIEYEEAEAGTNEDAIVPAYRALCDALRAYRALDGKGEG